MLELGMSGLMSEWTWAPPGMTTAVTLWPEPSGSTRMVFKGGENK
uniref:Uncharacterized protein n=2 Tax=Anguilla anguilla TaxID=7936 RepID=A0A0E9VMG8_ANGAN